MCGKLIENPYIGEVENVVMQLCKNCSAFGNVIERPKKQIKIKKIIKPKEEIIETIIENSNEIIKKARESKGLKQKDLAMKIAVKESIIHKIESGSLELNIDLAKKLERFFNIKLIENFKEEHKKVDLKGEGLTIGDLLNSK
jgi:putative transcription factor